jgi:hypothetical protein
MADSYGWNPKSVNESFLYRGSEARIRLKECCIKAKNNALYEALADEAAAKASVYDYLDGRSFLASRKELLDAIQDFANMPAPDIKVFDRARFAQLRLSEINRLLLEYGEGNEISSK